ncbi:uncharacterized protein LOC111263995 [Varroa jacobsoni]|uniref:Uncharacterized protein n=1 Tax=Varroa destructor TaxID=109461 RepID=A0A7M7JZW8_VARDE|nr:uncharacterized protein LOC111247146 [Varroa destructor]XP_022695285.1 uncharacterized protein LOC111263995 [Varroa jacobsoni]
MQPLYMSALPGIPCLLIFLFYQTSPVAGAEQVSSVVNTPLHTTVEHSVHPSTTRQKETWSPIIQLNQLVRPRRDRLPPGFKVLRVTPSEDGRQKFPPSTSEGAGPHVLITKLLDSVPRFYLNTPYYYPDGPTVVFPGGHQHPESPIVPLVVTPAAYPGSFVHSYPSYPEVVYPVYPTRGGVRPEHSVDINDQQAGGDQHHDERIVCQEHVKRIKGVSAVQKTPTYIAATNGVPVALKIFPQPQWVQISKHHQNSKNFHYNLL